MFSVKKMRTRDLPFATALANTMGWNMAAADFKLNMSLEPEGCLVLFKDEEPLGLATCISYGSVGWFGNLVVTEKSRRQGAGTYLVQSALEYLKRTGVTAVGLYAYPHLVKFYGSLGFEKAGAFAVLKASAVSARMRKAANLKSISEQDLQSVFDIDRVCFGASRKKLLEKVFLNSENIGYVAAEGSKTLGFVGAKVFGKTAEIGPLVSQSGSDETAVALLETVLQRLVGVEAYLYVPLAEEGLLHLAFESGFREEFRLQRMFFGRVLAKNCIYLAESLERG